MGAYILALSDNATTIGLACIAAVNPILIAVGGLISKRNHRATRSDVQQLHSCVDDLKGKLGLLDAQISVEGKTGEQ